MTTHRLTEQERDFLFSLIENITGTCQTGTFRREILASNVERRMRYVGASSLKAYLDYAMSDPSESDLLISALTIHTTSWFREFPHFEKLEESVRQRIVEHKQMFVEVLCAGCSTGEEAYSIALLLENVRFEYPGFEYRVYGVDLDPVSVAHATVGVYGSVAFSVIPESYRRHCLVGQGEVAGFFTPSAEVRKRCLFEVSDIRKCAAERRDSFDYIFCRNVLIYFSPKDIERLVRSLLTTLRTDGILCLGHSEAVDATQFGLRFVGDSTYVKRRAFADRGKSSEAVCRVLVVDDSPVARKAIEKSLERYGLIPISVASADEASEFLEKESVDVITLDVTMPGLDGPTWLNSRRLAGLGVPVVIVSESGPSQALAILGALENGAQDYIEKSSIRSEDFPAKILAISKSYRPRAQRADAVKRPMVPRMGSRRECPEVILIGASTGGTEAVMKLLDSMPANCPPVVVVQHISAYFARPLALRLAQQSKLKLGACSDGSPLLRGHIYVADDDRHIGIVGKRGKYVVLRSDGPPINRHRPSVDFLFKSAAVIPDVRASAILLTGMGADGAEGLKELCMKGCMTYAQDESSCVVFGMPKEAIALGAAAVVGNPYEIRQHLEWNMTQPAESDQKEPSKLSRLSAGRANLIQP